MERVVPERGEPDIRYVESGLVEVVVRERGPVDPGDADGPRNDRREPVPHDRVVRPAPARVVRIIEEVDGGVERLDDVVLEDHVRAAGDVDPPQPGDVLEPE